MTAFLLLEAEAAIERILARRESFTKADVVEELRAVPRIARWRAHIEELDADLDPERMLVNHFKSKVGAALNREDANGIRVYESYRVGRQHRWRPLRSMGVEQLRLIEQDASLFARRMDIKASVFSIFIDELERRGAMTVDEVYEDALPRILALRAA